MRRRSYRASGGAKFSILSNTIFCCRRSCFAGSTTLAIAVERADPRRRGKQMASFSVAYPLSYGVGSLITGIAVEAAGYVGMFFVLAALQALGLIFALVNAPKLRSPAN